MTRQDTPIVLFAAGSLEAAFAQIADSFSAAHHAKVQAHFGPCGVLREEIEWGETAHVFASASMAHPRALAADGRGGPVALFARNAMCALVRPGLDVTAETLVDRMLAADITVGISAPKADPAGDYAFEIFGRAEAVKAGAAAQLKDKALTLTGAPDSPPPPPGYSPYAWMIEQGAADIFLTYRTNGAAALAKNSDLRTVALPPELAVPAEYGLIVLSDAPEAALRLALYILSPAGQAILDASGFETVTLPANERS